MKDEGCHTNGYALSEYRNSNTYSETKSIKLKMEAASIKQFDRH